MDRTTMADDQRQSTTTATTTIMKIDDVISLERTFSIWDADNDPTNTSIDEDPEKILREYYHDFDFDFIYTNVDDEEMMMMTDMDHTDQTHGEENLSQRLNQLSTTAVDNKNKHDRTNPHISSSLSNREKRSLSTPSTPDTHPSKTRKLDDRVDEELIPDYLQQTNSTFLEFLLKHQLTMDRDGVQQLALLRHRIVLNNLDRTRWTVYFNASTGRWDTEESRKAKNVVDRRLWPAEVKEKLAVKLNKSIDTITMTEDDQQMCEHLIHEHLQNIDRTLADYHQQYRVEEQRLSSGIEHIDQAIDIFVQQQPILRWHQLRSNSYMVLLRYAYDIQLLEREYLHLQPTETQIQIAQCLCERRHAHTQAKYDLIELKQRIHYHLSIECVDRLFSHEHQRHMKDRQDKRTDSLIAAIIQAEDNVQECHEAFNEELHQQSAELTGKQIDLLYRRFKAIDRKLRDQHQLRIQSLLLQAYSSTIDSGEAIESSPSFVTTFVSYSPSLIMDAAAAAVHSFTAEQIQLLNRGPTYRAPCQINASSSSSSQLKEQLQQHYRSFQHDLNLVLNKFQVNPARSMFIHKEIKETYMTLFSLPLLASSSSPSTATAAAALHRRALYEKQVINSIRKQIQARNLILRRTADQNNVFYLGNRAIFEEKAHQWMSNTTNAVFEECHTIDDTQLQATQDYLMKVNKDINAEFDILFPNRKTHRDVLNKIWIETTTNVITKIQLPYLYFLPHVSTENNEISLKPIVVASQRYSATARLARFLDQLLRPLVRCYSQAVTFINGADFLRKLHEHIQNKKHQFHPKTMFIRASICNFHTLLPHGHLLIILKDFLLQHVAAPSIENISINTIIRLTAIFLHNNRFYYDGKIYRFAKGSPSAFPLTETLSTIFVLHWQRLLLDEPQLRDRFYGRCHSEIFFTWNESADEFRQLFGKIARRTPDIRIDFTMGLKLQFLNIHIENLNGDLFTCVHHDPRVQKCTLPYAVDNVHDAHSHWLRSSLIRAVRCCTSVFDFNQERIYLELTCLINGYSIDFVERRIHHFFQHFDALSLRSSLNQRVYEQLQHRLFNFVTEQHQLTRTNQDLESNHQLIRLSYFYQWGPRSEFDEKLKKILREHLQMPTQTSFEKKHQQIKLILTTQTKYSLNALLSQQKPQHPLL